MIASHRLAGLLLVATLALAAGAAPEEKEKKKWDMTTYQFVMFRAGEGAPADPAAQADHRALTARLLEQGVALLEGPLADGKVMTEVLVLDVRTREEAEALLKDDPLVVGGRLRPEILTWFAARGILARPTAPPARTDALLGLLVRPENAPDLPQEKLQDLQTGHMANIGAMAESGDLVIAGPFKDGGRLRGVLLFRTADRARIDALVARDPAVAAGRLALELYLWRLPAGVLPPRPSSPAP